MINDDDDTSFSTFFQILFFTFFMGKNFNIFLVNIFEFQNLVANAPLRKKINPTVYDAMYQCIIIHTELLLFWKQILTLKFTIYLNCIVIYMYYIKIL
jgi:hypothetical protein